MTIKSITYPTELRKIQDIRNANIDVFVELEDGKEYTLTICTPKFYEYYMEKEELNFIPAAPPDIIVKELTEDNIRNVLEIYCEEEEAYWLKLYYLAGKKQGVFSIDNMNKLINDIDIDLE